MELKVIGSNSAGNCYALDTGSEILLLEAGCKYKDMAKAIDYRIDEVVGCLVSHEHGDHAKYAEVYTQHGITIFGPKSLQDKFPFRYGTHFWLEAEKTAHIGNFDVVPFHNFHDVEIYGYLIRHKDMGTMLFSTDSYKLGMTLRGVEHFLIEANYSDEIIKDNFRNGVIDKAQVDRIMLSHMSLEYCIQYLRDCEAEKTAKTITLCHLSERNSDEELFRNTVAGAFGVPTYCATKGLVVELNKEEI